MRQFVEENAYLAPPPVVRPPRRPIGYRAADIWWLRRSELATRADGGISTESYPWGILGKDAIVAPRGLRVDDAVKAVLPHQCRQQPSVTREIAHADQ